LYLSILSCVTSSRNRTKRRWSKYTQQAVLQNPVYVMPSAAPVTSSMGIMPQQQQLIMDNGVLKRWQLVPLEGPAGTSERSVPSHATQEIEIPRGLSPPEPRYQGHGMAPQELPQPDRHNLVHEMPQHNSSTTYVEH
jgi:hypothetical protein